jgi:hypothetical protein
MNGLGRRTRRLAFVAGAALALLIVAASPREARTVVVSEGNGDVIARLPLPSDGRLALRYRHSIYREPALETFLVGSNLSLWLFELSSPSTAVLDHYALSGDRSVREGPPAGAASAPTSDCDRDRYREAHAGGRGAPPSAVHTRTRPSRDDLRSLRRGRLPLALEPPRPAGRLAPVKKVLKPL